MRKVKQIGSRVKNLYDLKVQDACKALRSKETDVPWISKKDDISLEKEVIMGVRVPSLCKSSLWHCFTMEDQLSGLKLHDYLNHL